MVFESIAAYFLDKYLSSYIDNFDGSNLKIGIWSGDVTLENLNLKTNALDELDLPFKIAFGHLKKLVMKIPWKNLYTESVKVTIDGLTILVVPKSSVAYDPERERKESRDNKLNELKRLIELERSKQEARSDKDTGADQQQSDTFTERIQMQIIRNLELEIKNIHIRFEDNFSKPDHPFSAGITLNSIEIKTTDENWVPTYLKENKNRVNKLASLVSLAIYCNSDDKLFSNELKETNIPLMQKMINNSVGINYILRPLSLTTKAVLSMKPSADDFMYPMFDLIITLESIGLNLNRLQYFDLVNMLNTIDYMFLNAKYQKYKPIDFDGSKAKQWWDFAYRAITETQIRPKREQFKWEKIRLISRTRRDYVNILKKKAKNSKLSPLDAEIEARCQEILDVFNLMLAKKQADVEIARIAQQEASQKSTWWGWITSTTSTTDNEDTAKLNEAINLSSDEKSKLYDAIGYTEESSYSDYPEDFVGFKLKFFLKKFEVKLIDGEYKNNEKPTYISNNNLLHLVIDNMEANFVQYPVVKGFKISSSVKSILLTGSSNDTIDHKREENVIDKISPVLVEPDLKQDNFLEFTYEVNSIDTSSKKRLELSSKSLKFIYHAVTVNNIVYFFRSSEPTSQKRLKNAALRTINQVKQRSILYMKNNIGKIQQMDLNIDILPSYLLVPENGKLTEFSKTICINFGHLSLKSEPKDEDEENFQSAEEEDEGEAINKKYKSSDKTIDLEKVEKELESSKTEVIQASYWKYQIRLDQIQILLIKDLLDFEKIKSNNADSILLDKLYILKPLDLMLNIHQCVFTDDVTLPALRVFGDLPLIEFNLTDFKLEQIILLFLSIPFPKNKELLERSESFNDMTDQSEDLEHISLPSRKLSDSKVLKLENLQQALNLEFSFEIKEINLVLKETKIRHFDRISFNIRSFGTRILQKSYDTCVFVYLNEIKCEYGLFNDVNGSQLYLFSSTSFDKFKTNRSFIEINVTMTDMLSPTLVLLHDNVLMNVDVKLAAIDLVANLVAFRNILNFVDSLEKNLNASKYLQLESDIQKQEKAEKKSFTDHTLLTDEQIKSLLVKKHVEQTKKKALIDLNLIQFKIKARFDGIRARLCTSKQNYFYADITNFKLNAIGKTTRYDVNFSLNSINVIDLERDVIYNKILCPKEEGQNLVVIELTMHNAPKTPLAETSLLEARSQKEKYYFKNYMNQNFFDLDVKARISKIKAVFLFCKLDKFLGLLRILENNGNNQIKEKSTQKLNEAKKLDETLNEPSSTFLFLFRIKLDVNIEAPLIVLPESSKSLSALLLDCGLLTINTELDINDKYFKSGSCVLDENCLNYKCKLPPVVEIQKVNLSKMEVSRAILDKNLNISNELFLINCSELNVTVRRNLQPELYIDVQSMSINVVYGGLLVSLSKSDYSFVIQLLQNLGEKVKQIEDSDVPEFPISHEIKSKKKVEKQTELKDTSFNKCEETKGIPKLSVKVFIESIQMFLHDEEYIQTDNLKDVRKKENAFSNMEIQNLQLELNIYNDTEDERESLKTMFLVDAIVLDDTKPVKSGNKPVRLIEKYNSKKKASLAPMILLNYEQKVIRTDDEEQTSIHFIPEKKVDADISFMRVCVNVDYLLTLYDFFIEGLPKKPETTGDKIEFALSEEELLAVNQRLFCNVKIEHPQFILYENQNDLKKSNSLIIDGLMRFNMSLLDKKTKIYGSIDDLMIRLRSFVIKRVLKRKTYVFLSPTTMSLSGVIEETGDYKSADEVDKKSHAFIFDMQDLSLNLSPQMLTTSIKMMNSIQNSLDQRFKTEVVEVGEEETKIRFESLFQTVSFNIEDFWFTQQKNGKSSSKNSFLESSSSSLISSHSKHSMTSSEAVKTIKDQLIIRTGKILLKLEAGVSDQLPLLCLNMTVNGEFSNWTYRPSLNLGIICEMAYFNEPLSVWEPVIEPFEYQSDMLKPYEFSIEMITNMDIETYEKSSHKKSDDSKLSSHLNNLRPVRTFQISSIIPLQFVMTKTFVSMLDRVSRLFVITNEMETKGQEQVEYETYEQEEDLLLEQYRNRLDENVVMMEDFETDDECEDEENPSFNFLIKNELGFDVNLQALTGFKFRNIDSIDPLRNKVSNIEKISLKNNSVCPINLEYDFMGGFQSSLKALEEPEKQKSSMKFSLEIIGSEWQPATISLGRSDLVGYYMCKKQSTQIELNEKLIICQTVNKLDKRRIYLRSPVQVVNHLNVEIGLSYPLQALKNRDYSFSDTKWEDTVVPTCGKWSLPIELVSQRFTDYIKIAPLGDGENYDKQVINWSSEANHKLLEFNNHMFIQVLIEKEPLNIFQNNINKIDFIYNIILLPCINFRNYLPYPIKYQVINNQDGEHASIKPKKADTKLLKPGESAKLINAKLGSTLYLQMENYAKSSWSSSPSIEFNDSNKKIIGTESNRIEETNVIEFRSDSAKIITMYSNLVMENHCSSLTIYAPYWVLNQTKLPLDYKFQGLDDEINLIDSTFTDTPSFLKINSKVLKIQNKKLLIRVNERVDSTEWSNVVSIDAVGNNGTVCSKSSDKTNGKIYEIGVDIKLQKSSNGLTKILKLTPHFLLINNTNLFLNVHEVRPNNEKSISNLNISPNSIIPFWPSINYSSKEKNCLSFQPMKTKTEHKKPDFSKPFWYNWKHSTVLTFENDFEALFVDCAPSEEIVRIIIKPYEYGMAPILVVNCLDNVPVVLKQNGEGDDQTFLMPYQYKIQTWKNPIGKRELLWSCGVTMDQVYNLDTLQSKQQFLIANDRTGFIVSFLDGVQKVVMFVDSLENLNDEIADLKEIKGDEFVLSLNNMSLSLIDDLREVELLFVSLTSSSIDWGEKVNKKSKVFKSFPTHKTEKIEQVYQKFLEQNPDQGVIKSPSGSSLTKSTSKAASYKTIAIDEEDEVDFERMVLFVGKEEVKIERKYAPGLYINFFSSSSQTTLHLVVHKLQIDNQLYECVFPVMFSKVLPPKSIATQNVIKPIIELSMVKSHNQRTNTTEMKYFKVLIQEFFVKVDITFINAITEFLTNDEEKKYVRDSTEFFQEINDIKKSFRDVFETIDNLNQKQTTNDRIYYDYVHISPIKMHLSFSLAGTDAFKDTNIFINNPFFKSIGLALTDMQDIVFKLGYFEVKGTVCTSKEFTTEAIEHYKTQIIKQAYIIFLGLDVLGNPYGLLSGLAEGVESLFYEPYAGIVQGPGEFVEGVALGLRGLVGGTLGGAAGAFSKITGTLGKTIATLSMDKEFQKSRQKATESKHTLVQNIGQNLVMGLVGGFTGVLQKPIEGARTGGGAGFFEGLGKGIIGVVAKPTVGVIDFASQSLEGIRKIAVQEESVERVRPPRSIYKDRIIRPFKRKEAQTVFILKGLEKGKFLNDQYKASLEISPQSILIATDRHVIFVEKNQLLGNWKQEWCFEINELLHEPKFVKNVIEIWLKKTESSFFGSGQHLKKTVQYKDEKSALKFIVKVTQVLNEQDF